MNKLLFTLITTFIIVCSVTFGVKTLATEQQYLNALGQPLPVTVPQTTPSGNDLLDTLLPSQKNCNYVLLKRYEPFSDVNNSFPGLSGMTVPGTKGQPCINVGGPAVEGLLKILFMTAITIVITLTVVNIAVSGIQYMTQEANVAKKGAAKKRLTDSFIALALGLMSYTILYTVNQQLVNFTFNPASIDATGAIARGNADAVAALAQGPLSSDIVGFEALLAPIITTVVNQYGQPVTSPTGYVNPYTGQPCTPTGVPDYLENPNTPGGGAILSRRASFLASTYQLPLAILDPCVPVSALGANGGLPNPTGEITVRILSITNQTLPRATAHGTIIVNGTNYSFKSGGAGLGYLPIGTYTVTNGDFAFGGIQGRRNEPPSMLVEGYGYSFNLNDKADPRAGGTLRTLLRIHPDGGGPGTEGCIGIQGGRVLQEQFFNNLKTLLQQNGGRYTLRVSM